MTPGSALRPRRALLDTSVVIDFPPAEVAEVCDEVAVSAVTIGELHFGVTAAPDPLTQLYRRRRVQTVLDRFEVLASTPPPPSTTARWLPSCANTGATHGRRTHLQIAATAARHGLMLLTRNGRDFNGLDSALHVIDLPNRPIG